MSFLKKYGALLLTVGATVATVLSPGLQSAVGAHPMVSGALVIASNILHSILPGVFGEPQPQGK